LLNFACIVKLVQQIIDIKIWPIKKTMEKQ